MGSGSGRRDWEQAAAWATAPVTTVPLTTPPTTSVTAVQVVMNARNSEDLAAYKGKLKGAIVLRGTPAVIRPVSDASVFGGPPRANPRGEAQALHNAGRLAWGSGPRGEPPNYTGLDVVIVREGKIAALYVFLDSAAS